MEHNLEKIFKNAKEDNIKNITNNIEINQIAAWKKMKIISDKHLIDVLKNLNIFFASVCLRKIKIFILKESL